MNNQLRTVLLLVFSFFLLSVANAQIDDNRYKVTLNPQDLGTCGGANNSLEVVTILGKNATCHAFSITFTLPTGVEYASGSANITSQTGSGDFTVTEGGTPNAPIFTLQRPNDDNWAVNDQVVLSFERSAGCEAVQFLNASGLFKDAHTIDFIDASGAKTVSDNDLSISSYSLNAASLSIGSISTIDANVGDSYTRNVTLSQGGNGCTNTLSYSVELGTDVDDVYSLSYNGTLLNPSATNGNTLSYDIDLGAAPFIGVGNADGCFDNGESIIFEESFRVDDCVNTSIIHNAFWGCNDGETCQAAAPQTGSLNFGANVPDITVTKVGGPANTELCNAISYTVRIENTNAVAGAMALDVNINLGLGHNSSPISTASSNPLWAFDYENTRSVSNFRFGNNPAFATITSNSDVYATRGSGNTVSIPQDFFGSDPDGIGVGFEDLDNDGFFDDLAPGASTELTFDFEIDPKSNCGTGRFDYMTWEHTYFDVFFKDQCKGERLPERIDLNYFNIIRDYQQITEINAPSDIVDNESFNISIAPSLYVGGTGAPFCNGSAMLSNDQSSVFTITITVPNGMTLQAGAPVEFAQTGNTITYTTTEMSGTYFNENVDFPIDFSCGPNGVQSIPYTTSYSCTGNSGSCFLEDIHCGTINIYTHCPGGCSGPGITSFDANRSTAGWTDSSMNTPVVLDANVHELKKYLAGDTMTLITTAKINNASLDNLYLDVDYHTASLAAGGPDVISFVDGTITINDISSGSQSGAITIAPTQATNGSTDHILTFDLTSYRSMISGTYEYGEGLETDEITLELNFVFSKDFKDIDYHELSSFRGEFYAFTDYPVNTMKMSCDTWGDRAYYSRPRIYGSNQAQSTNGCMPENGILYYTHNMAPADMYPSEYRPMTTWIRTVVDIPEGARFTGNITSTSFNGAYSTATGEFIATENNGQITIERGPGFADQDQRALIYPRFNVEFTGTCLSPGSATYDYTVFYNDFAYADPTPTNFTNTNTFTYAQPTFILQSPTPTLNGANFTADFDVTLSNTSPQNVAFNWLQLTVPNGLTITGAVSLDNFGTETPINYHLAPGFAWIEAGSVATGETANIRFKATYTNCNDLSVLVEHGWDCQGYPGYPDTNIDVSDFQALNTSCYQRSTTLTLQPLEAQIQLDITNQPNTPQDVCTPFHIELDMISAQAADLVSPYLEFVIPGGQTAMTIVSSVEYPKNSGDVQPVTITMANGLAKVNLLDHTAIASINGIAGNPAVNSPDARTAHIDLELRMECGFISNSPIIFKGYGESPCGDLALGNGTRKVSNPLEANGAVAPYTALSTINLPNFGAPLQGCGTQETINIVTTIGGGTTGTQDFGRVILRNGIEFVPATFVANGPNTAVFNSVTIVGDHQEIIVEYPSGVNNTETISFDFDIITLNNICDATGEVNIINYVISNSIDCGAMNCGDFEVATGFSYEILPLEKPVLVGSTSNANSYYTTKPNGDYDFNLSFNLENTSNVNAMAAYTYNVYCADVNGDIMGTSIANGTTNNPVSAGATSNQQLSFTISNQPCGSNSVVIEMIPSATNCQCELIQFVLPIESGSPLNLDNDNDGIPDNVEAYNGDHDNDGIHDYEDPDFCTLNFQGVNGWDCSTMGLPDPDADLDNDGTPNYFDADFPTCGGLNAAGICTNFDIDNDGVPNHLDLDADNDGITDLVEVGGTTTTNLSDIDGDGLVDMYDNDDTDGPQGASPCAPQSNCVKINSTSNIFDTNANGLTNNNNDMDGDGFMNPYDLDSDNDGILDTVEAQPLGSFNAPGAIDPATGIPAIGSDTDGIGTPENNDTDGNPDYLDTDSDGDGCADAVEAAGTFTPDDLSIDNNLANTSAEVDTNGVPTVANGGQASTTEVIVSGPDADLDGIADACDPVFNDNDQDGVADAVDLDNDNDGITDVEELGEAYINFQPPCAGNTLNFSGIFTEEPGGDGNIATFLQGEVFRFPNVSVGIDALVTIVQTFNTSIPLLDDNTTDPNSFKPQTTFNLSNVGDQAFTEYNFQFVQAGTVNPVILDEFFVNFNDVDGNNNYGEQNWSQSPASYTTNGVTGISIENQTHTQWLIGTAGSVEFPGASNANPEVNFSTRHLSKSSYSIRLGIVARAVNTSFTGRQHSVEFECLTNFVNPSTFIIDFDGDGIPNYLDLDSDNDGILDVIEAGGTDDDGDGIADGAVNTVSGIPASAGTGTNPINTDGTVGPDYLDIDADDDGIVDNIEGQLTGAYQPPLMADDDQDGIDNQYDTDFAGSTPFTVENTDGDALEDYRDLDSDDDGINDLIEGWDTDADGTPETIPSGNDIDNDGLDDAFDSDTASPEPTGGQIHDSFPDAQQPGGNLDWRQGLDRDGDGIMDNIDLDNDNDGIPDIVEGFADLDNDGILDRYDLDSDNDGIPDIIEAGGTDADGDGKVDNFTDIDNDGLHDPLDNLNGGASGQEVLNGTPLPDLDSDLDGVKDRIDLDSDNDGIPDVLEAGGTDDDGDGTIDGFTDVDNDGFADSVDTDDNTTPAALDGTGTSLPDINSDSDGIPDRLDVDSDNDGLTDVFEAGGTDADNDGRIDNFADNDNDGFADSVDTDNNTTPMALDGLGTPLPKDDFDKDGRPNYLDIDSDNDGITDTTEAGGTDLDGNGEIDGFADPNGDGFDDATAASPLSVPNTDGNTGDGPDYLDIDADDDGIPDNIEAQPTATYVQPNGTSAQNGLDTAYTTGFVPEDTDGDLIPDYLDPDSDNDGIDDLTEGGRGTLTGVDTDGDGLDDGFEGADLNDPTDVNDEIDDPTALPDVQVAGGDVDYRQGLDSDGDGVLDDQEIADGTDPNDPCDFEIASITEPQGGNWLLADCDGDGATNEQEVADNTNPEDPCDFNTSSVTLALSGDYLISDCDGDGVTNGTEITDGTDPDDPCDFMQANVTLDRSGDWLLADCDGDQIPNGQELTDGTDPDDPCSSKGGTPPAGVPCDIIIETDLVNPGVNEGIFRITNIESYPNNTVRIYNRWGVLVFETKGYDNGSNAFRGISNGRATVQKSEQLPVGVYFYIIEYVNHDVPSTKSGYLYVNR